MSLAVLSFVNLSRQDAFLSVRDATGELQFVAIVAPGSVLRQATTAGWKWNLVANDSIEFSAQDKNTVYLISGTGVHEVTDAQMLVVKSEASAADFDFPSVIGGG